ncbi:MAG: hypothetical protein ACE5R6_18710 [Candidatus Heimdallarchaeota archaeon]
MKIDAYGCSKLFLLTLTLSMIVQNNGINVLFSLNSKLESSPKWQQARIAGTELWLGISEEELQSVIEELADQGVNMFCLDIGITNDYNLFLHPDEAILFVKRVCELAHSHQIQVFVYLSGFELQTFDAENNDHSILQDHPDWIQQDLNGQLAVFDYEYARKHNIHWLLEEGMEEDAWITPYAREWRAQFMDIVRKLAGTGVDALYVDTAYWMSHFSGWENSWASFDSYTMKAFTITTGLNPPTKNVIGDLDDFSFYSWALFRRKAITDFFTDIKSNATSIAPEIAVIAECFPAFTRHALLTGSDPMFLWDVVDLVTHEFGFHQGEGGADAYTPLNWLLQVSAIVLLRGIDQIHPTWILSYARSPEASAVLAATIVMLGGNFWETKDPIMTGTVDESYRKALFNWVETYEDDIYGGWEIPHAIGIYFSENTRDFVFYPDSISEDATDYDYIGGPHIKELLGTVMMAFRSHLPIKVVTYRDLPELNHTCDLLYLPNVAAMSDEEAELITQYAASHPLIVTGSSSQYYEDGKERENNALADLIKNGSTNRLLHEAEGTHLFIKETPGYDFFLRMVSNEDEALSFSTSPEEYLFLELLDEASYQNPIQTNAPPSVIIQPYSRAGELNIRIINLSGLGNGQRVPEPVTFSLAMKANDLTVSIEQADVELAAILVEQEGAFEVIPYHIALHNKVHYIVISNMIGVGVILLVYKIRRKRTW